MKQQEDMRGDNRTANMNLAMCWKKQTITSHKFNKMKKIKQFDSLVLEIRSILSENRCSYSESQKAALNECINLLEGDNFNEKTMLNVDWELFSEVVKIIILIYFDK